MSNQPPVILTVAGSDSGGGAGIQADLRVFAALGAFGTSTITMVTAQNSHGIQSVHTVPSDVVSAQITSVTTDLALAASKTGALATAETVEVVASAAATGRLPHLVVDPVLVSSSGQMLVEDRAIPVYLKYLFPFVSVITPNADEASALTGFKVTSIDNMIEVGKRLLDYGPTTVVVSGGASGIDVVIDSDGFELLHLTPVQSRNTHGTGCTFSAAIAVFLGEGFPHRTAARMAKSFTHEALLGSAGWNLGAGNGPLDHLNTSVLKHSQG